MDELPVEVVAIAGGRRSGFLAFAGDGEVLRLTCLDHEERGPHGLAAEALACAGGTIRATDQAARARWREAKAIARLESSLDRGPAAG